MTSSKVGAFVLLALTSGTVHAGNFVGNGGIVVGGTCDPDDRSAETLQVLDFYETDGDAPRRIDLGDETSSVTEKLEIAMRRLERLDSPRASLYRQWLAEFDRDSTDYPDQTDFPPPADTGRIVGPLPDGCIAKQIIAQRQTSGTHHRRYLIKRKLFDQLDDENEAGLRLHEIVYRDAIRRGAYTSEATRVFVRALASSDFDQMESSDYERLLLDLGLVGWAVPSEVLRNGSRWSVRYFDQPLGTALAALEFCQALSNQASILRDEDLASSYAATVAWQKSAAAKRFADLAGDGEVAHWLARAKIVTSSRLHLNTGSGAGDSREIGVMCIYQGGSL